MSVALHAFLQYFNERFDICGAIVPMRYSPACLLENKTQTSANTRGPMRSCEYKCLGIFLGECDRMNVLEDEEDKEHKVQSAIIITIGSCRVEHCSSPTHILG